jgi:glutathione S-transferase
MRTLYHFQFSPFSRRTRLALAQKGVAVELKEGRSNPVFVEEVRKLWPLRTFPVLVEQDGRAVGDSNAIARYLDAAYPAGRPLWPTEPDAARTSVEVASLVDGALNLIIDVGTRYHALRADAAWGTVEGELIGRAQAALDALGKRAEATGPRPLTGTSMDAWCAADMWLFTAVAWLDGLPARAESGQSPLARQLIALPWVIPAPLLRWRDAFVEREDVLALG